MKNFETQKLKLPSVGDVYWCNIPEASSTHICIINKVGAFQDPYRFEGLAHFFEHLPFRGTVKLPTKLDIGGPIERLGGFVNASTDLMETIFEVEVPTSIEALMVGMNTLQQLMLAPLLHQDAVDAEREVIAAERRMKENNMAREDFVRVHTNLFGTYIGNRNWVLGTDESLQRIQQSDLQAFHEQYYRHGNFTFIVCGNFPKRRCEAFLTKALASWSSANPSGRPKLSPLQPMLGAGESWESRGMNTKVPVLSMFAPAYVGGDVREQSMARHWHVLRLINDILISRGMTAKLFQELREKRNLVYSVGGKVQHYEKNLGTWALTVSLKQREDAQTVRDVIETLLSAPGTFTGEDLDSAKKALLGHLDLQMRSPRNVTSWIRSSLMFEEPHRTVRGWRRRIQHTTLDELRYAVERFYTPNAHWNWVTFLPD